MIDSGRPPVRRSRLLILWALFFLMCVGLGYPTLGRYDPRDPRAQFGGTSALYHWQVTGDPQEGVRGPSLVHFRYRLLVPTVARVFYLAGRNHVGSWDPGFFGLLMANAAFCATTALLLFLLACEILPDSTSALIAPLLYLLTFDVSNFLLAGLVDSGEACALVALVWCLRRERFAWLPLLGIAGTLAKETFVPLSVVFMGGWMAVSWPAATSGYRRRQLVGLVLLGVTALVTLTVVFSVANGQLVFPWQLETSGTTVGVTLGDRAMRLVSDRGLLYLFGWLAPLGLFGLRSCPRAWIAGATACALALVVLGVYNGEPGVARSLFIVFGPLLSLGSAVTLSRGF